MSPTDFVENSLNWSSPDKGYGVTVMCCNVVCDRLNEIANAVERATADTFGGNLTEPSFNEIQPRTAAGNEMHMKTRMPFQPAIDARVFMRRIIIGDQMKLHIGRRLLVNQPEEFEPLLMTVTRQASTQQGSLQQVQRRKQRGGSIPFIVMRHCPAPSFFQRQSGLGSVQSLNLTFFHLRTIPERVPAG